MPMYKLYFCQWNCIKLSQKPIDIVSLVLSNLDISATQDKLSNLCPSWSGKTYLQPLFAVVFITVVGFKQTSPKMTIKKLSLKMQKLQKGNNNHCYV